MRHGGAIVVCLLAAASAACRQPLEKGPRGASADGAAIRLVDQFAPASLAGTSAPPAAQAGAAAARSWSFAVQPAKGPTCTAGRGITGLAVRDGRLAGRTTSDFPILDCPVSDTAGDPDTVHAIEIRISASAPAELAIATSGKEEPNFDEEIAQARETEWRPKTPLIADGDVHPYTLEFPFSTKLDSVKHLFIRPSNAAGTEFAIESRNPPRGAPRAPGVDPLRSRLARARRDLPGVARLAHARDAALRGDAAAATALARPLAGLARQPAAHLRRQRGDRRERQAGDATPAHGHARRNGNALRWSSTRSPASA